MKVMQTYTIDPAVVSWLEEMANDDPTFKKSQFVNDVLRDLMDKQKTKQATLVKCADCGADYTSSLPGCPHCTVKRIKTKREKERAEQEAEAEARKKAEKEQKRMAEREKEAREYCYYKEIEGKMKKLDDVFEELNREVITNEKLPSRERLEQVVDKYVTADVNLGWKNIMDYFKLRGKFEGEANG